MKIKHNVIHVYILLLLVSGCGENPLTPQPEVGPIVFTSTRDGKEQIYAMNEDGSNITRITRSDFSNFNPRWSRDGKSIVFNSRRSANIHFRAIVMADANGDNERVLLEHGLWPVFSPTGDKIAFSYDTLLPGFGTPYDIVIYDLKTDETYMFKKDSSSNDIINDWSPNGKYLLITKRITKLINQKSETHHQIFLIDVETGIEIQLAGGRFCNWGKFSPDGRAIVFACSDSSTGGRDIFTINIDGSNKKNLTKSPGMHEFSATWSSDGRKIAYLAADEGFSRYHIFIINSDGTDKRCLMDDEFEITSIDWRWNQ